jgi:hypothetical protein
MQFREDSVRRAEEGPGSKALCDSRQRGEKEAGNISCSQRTGAKSCGATPGR